MGERNDRQTEDEEASLALIDAGLVGVEISTDDASALIKETDAEEAKEPSFISTAGVLHMLYETQKAIVAQAKKSASEAIVQGFSYLTVHFNHLGFSEADRCEVVDHIGKAKSANTALAPNISSKEKRKFYIDKAIALCRHEKMVAILGEKSDWTVSGVQAAFADLKLTTRNSIRKLVTEKTDDSTDATGGEPSPEDSYQELVRRVVELDEDTFARFTADVAAHREQNATLIAGLNAQIGNGSAEATL